MNKFLLSIFLVLYVLQLGSVEMKREIEFNKESEIIIRGSEKYHLAFTDIERLPDGKLLVAYRQGESHVDPSGKIIMHYGSEDGVLWEGPRVVYDDPEFDCRDPSLSLLADNDIALTFFKYHKTSNKSGDSLALVHTFISLSDDLGETFSEPLQIDPGNMTYSGYEVVKSDGVWFLGNDIIPIKASSSGIIRTIDGSLVLPMYCKSPGIFGPVTFAESDYGNNWRIKEILSGEIDELQPNEPSVVVVSDDLWLMHVRTQKEGGFTYQSSSHDGGKTWTKYRSLGFVGHSPELITLSNGVVLAAYRVIDEKVKVAFIYSSDKGENWSEFTVVEEWENADCGYPGIVELPGSRFIISYYAVTKDKSVIKAAIYSFKN